MKKELKQKQSIFRGLRREISYVWKSDLQQLYLVPLTKAHKIEFIEGFLLSPRIVK